MAIMLVWWILAIIGLVALVRWAVHFPERRQGDGSPLEILRDRYARGEIDKREYEERKRTLEA